MKEIIRPGNSKSGIKIKYNATCPYCMCQFTYENEDIYVNNFGIGESLVQCPHCGKPTIACKYPDFERYTYE